MRLGLLIFRFPSKKRNRYAQRQHHRIQSPLGGVQKKTELPPIKVLFKEHVTDLTEPNEIACYVLCVFLKVSRRKVKKNKLKFSQRILRKHVSPLTILNINLKLNVMQQCQQTKSICEIRKQIRSLTLEIIEDDLRGSHV